MNEYDPVLRDLARYTAEQAAAEREDEAIEQTMQELGCTRCEARAILQKIRREAQEDLAAQVWG